MDNVTTTELWSTAIMPSRIPCTNKCSFSHGTLLVLVWAVLSYAAFYHTLGVIPLLPIPNEVQFGLKIVYGFLLLLMPVAGWLGDTWIGRYRVIISGSLLSIVAHWTILIAFIVLQFNWTPIPALAVLCIAMPVSIIGTGSIMVTVLPFTIDQMIGASDVAISAAVQWIWWGLSVAGVTQELLLCMPIVISIPQLTGMQAALFLVIVAFCLSLILITDCLYHHKLEVHFKPFSPLKTALGVLNYARKTKYPERRSALTYIDEEEPSRLDYGKHKFGGPFTEEEVEDVKTILRTGVFFVVILIGNLFCDGFNSLIHAQIIPSTADTRSCVQSLTQLAVYSTAVIMIPVYRLILFPLLRNKLPNYLKRVGAGLVLVFISSLLDLTLDTIGHTLSNSTQCMFDTSAVPANTLPISPYWLLIRDLAIGLGYLLIFVNLTEVFLAQFPISLRGTAIGIGMIMIAIGQTIRSGIILILCQLNLNNVTPSCGFYYYLVQSIFIMLCLVVFVFVAKRYKLRERERHVNIQAIVEEHHERYLNQEEEYMRETADKYKLLSTIELAQ